MMNVSADRRVPSSDSQAKLFGRESECQVLTRLLTEALEAHSQVLVLRGEAGIGKTALLDHLANSATGWVVARTGGVDAEKELAYAGLQQLCSSMVEQIECGSTPRRDAVATAIGLKGGDAPDRLLVGLGVLDLFAAIAARQPLVCLVDDFQWLDQASAQVLGFVARRLQGESVVLVLAARPYCDDTSLSGLPALRISGLREADARTLLASSLLAPLDPAIRDQYVAETRGNPLALLEGPRALTPAALAGGFALPNGPPIDVRLDHAFKRRLVVLPADAREMLLLAAAEPLGEPSLLWRAADRLGLGPAAVEAATAAELLDIGARVRFRHPHGRATVYRGASGEDRRRAHAALADATDPATDPDRQIWHRAHAVSGTDEDVANELERSAPRASARGGIPAAAAFLTRAMELSAAPGRRGGRALAAARLTIDAGAPESAAELLRVAERSPLSDVDQAEVERLWAQLAFTLTHGGEAPSLLLHAAKRLEGIDVRLARDTYFEALSAAQFAGRLAGGVGVLEVAAAARLAPRPIGPPSPCDLLLDGLARRGTDGLQASAPLLHRALLAFRSADLPPEDGRRGLFRASTTALDLWDEDSAGVLANRHLRLARDMGAVAALPLALTLRIALHVLAGELTDAAMLIKEVNAVISVTGAHMAPYGELLLAAWKGEDDQAQTLMAATEREVTARGEGMGLSVIEWASALLASAAGRYEAALELGQRASQHPEELAVSTWGLIEVVEGAARLGDIDRAIDGIRRLSASTRAAGTNWALGVEARSRALVCDGEKAEHHYRGAIRLLRQTRARPELARSHLVYGEWLRRGKRRVDAREHLRAAHELFVSMGINGFAERARRELLATGETVRKRSVHTITELTPQERQIARLAADFHQNSEIAAQLFLSPRTVEWHLRKIFTKLGISARRELRSALAQEPGSRPGVSPGFTRSATSHA